MNRINSKPEDIFQHPLYPSLSDMILIMSDSAFSFPVTGNGKDVLNIRFNEDGQPIRKVVRRSNYRQSYQLFSKKMKREMSCESVIEFNGSYILEAMHEVKSFQMQPAEISYLLDGKAHRHIPDALIHFNDNKKCFLEFKSNKELDSSDLIARTRLLKRNLPIHGYGYLVICDQQVSGISLINAKTLVHIQHSEISQEILLRIQHFLKAFEMPSIKHLLEAFKEVPDCKSIVYQLIKNGLISYDTDSIISEVSDIYWKENN